MAVRDYDIVFYDTVGMAYTGLTPQRQGLGGSEFEAILLAEALAARGARVLVLNNTPAPEHCNGVEYAHHSESSRVPRCAALILQRYSTLPAIDAAKILIAASDIPGSAYDHLDGLVASARDVTLVAVSEWQKELFPRNWSRTVIPNMLPDFVYEVERSVNPRKFVYASAALKGLKETIEAWKELVGDGNPRQLELHVCTPGYDSYDANALGALGVRFLGSLPFAQVVEEIATSAGLFFVNTHSETFCIVAALAEALRRRTHILCASHPGALPTTLNSPLLTTEREKFLADFNAALAAPGDPRWHGAAKDYRSSSIVAQWQALLAAPPRERPKLGARICLSMIVKNEAHVIERCLRSVKPYIHAWAISDTGSSDGTQQIVRDFLADLPGELIERPWVDFATNRNQALELAKRFGDYALVIDADDTLAADAGFAWPELGAAGYSLEIVDTGSTHYQRMALPRLDANWEWRGVLHEALCTPTAISTPLLPGLRILRIHNDGARSQRPAAEKFAHDAQVLERALRDEPGNARYAFYLAQSHRDAGNLPAAIAAYAQRASMGGWDEEVYFSKLQIAALKERGGAPYAEIVAAYLDAYDFRPTRAEAPCELARYLRLQQRYTAAREFARIASGIALPADLLFLDHGVYNWRARDELAVSSYWTGERELSARVCRELLADARLPEHERERVRRNLDFALGKT